MIGRGTIQKYEYRPATIIIMGLINDKGVASYADICDCVLYGDCIPQMDEDHNPLTRNKILSYMRLLISDGIVKKTSYKEQKLLNRKHSALNRAYYRLSPTGYSIYFRKPEWKEYYETQTRATPQAICGGN